MVEPSVRAMPGPTDNDISNYTLLASLLDQLDGFIAPVSTPAGILTFTLWACFHDLFHDKCHGSWFLTTTMTDTGFTDGASSQEVYVSTLIWLQNHDSKHSHRTSPWFSPQNHDRCMTASFPDGTWLFLHQTASNLEIDAVLEVIPWRGIWLRLAPPPNSWEDIFKATKTHHQSQLNHLSGHRSHFFIGTRSTILVIKRSFVRHQSLISFLELPCTSFLSTRPCWYLGDIF